MTPDQIRKMPASLIEGIRSGSISAQEAQMKVKELEIQGQRADTAQTQMVGELKHQTAEEEQARKTLANTTANDAAMRSQNAAALEETTRANQAREAEAARAKPLEAAKDLQARPWYQKGLETVFPDSDATKQMRATMNGSFSAPQVGQTIVHPSGAKITRHR